MRHGATVSAPGHDDGDDRGAVYALAPVRVPLPQTIVVVTVLAGTLAGCGGSGSGADNGVGAKSPDAIVAAASTATNKAHAVHVAGSLVSGGTPIALDMHLAAGAGGRGQTSESGLSFQLVSVNKTVYVNGSPAFWKHFGGAAAAQLLQGKWLKAPASNASFGSLTTLTDFHQFLSGVLGSHGTLTKGSVTTVNGQKAIPINDHSGDGGTLYVATTGPAYPVALEKKGSGGGRVLFDRWNEPVSLTAPANAVDVSQLKLR